MAKIVFISLYDRNANGLRLMSANLKRHGHTCSLIFLKQYRTQPSGLVDTEVGEYPWVGINPQGHPFKYASCSRVSSTEYALLRELLTELSPDVLGISVTTPIRKQCDELTQFVKSISVVPVIWGGYDPTVNAADCLRLCDYACVGEGDHTILDIAKRIDLNQPFDTTPNISFLRNGKTVTNPKGPLEMNIDNFPWKDNSPEDKYYIDDDRLEKRHPILNDKETGTYQAMSARGCPYRCSYCCEATFKDLYQGEKFLRRRSPEDFVAELATVKEQFGLRKMIFEDEIFAMNLAWLEKFAPLYREKVNLPFTAYIYPTRNIDKILTLLRDVGLSYCCLALESGSERINKVVFQRVYDRKLFLETASICKRLGISYYTDVITYNPYETEKDLKDTLDVLTEMDGGFNISINKLFILPGTAFYEMAKADGALHKSLVEPKLFDFYVRLYLMCANSSLSRRLIPLFRRLRFLKRHPERLNPQKLDAYLNHWMQQMNRRHNTIKTNLRKITNPICEMARVSLRGILPQSTTLSKFSAVPKRLTEVH